MRDSDKDPGLLRNILDDVNKLLLLTSDINIKTLPINDLRFYGVVKLIEIIGESAYKLTKEFKNNHPQTPWDMILGMRHILVHDYYNVDPKYIRYTIQEDLIPLKSQLETYVKEFKIKD